MEIISVKCTCCGANLKIESDSTHIKCEYCGKELLIKHREPQKTADSSETDSTDYFAGFYTVLNIAKKRKVVIALSILFAVLSVVAVIVSVYMSNRLIDDFVNIGGSGQTNGNGADSKIYKRAGQYKVGTDISAGEYVLFPTNNMGSVTVTMTPNAALGTSDFLYIQNFPGRQYLRVEEGEYVKLSLCNLYKTEDADLVRPNEDGAYAEGQYKVGIDIPAGEYMLRQSGSITASVVVTLTPYAHVGSENFVGIENFNGQYYITLRDGWYVSYQRSALQAVA